MHFEFDSKFSISVEIHPRMAWIYCRLSKQLLVDPRHAWMHVLDINFNRGSEPVAQQRDPTPCRSVRSQETVEGGVVWVGRTAGAMDGAYEPTRTYLRRVLPTHTAPPSPRNPAFDVAPTGVQGAALQTKNYSASRCTWRQSSAASARTASSASGRCSNPSS
ncbi:hypothetical protein C1930_11545 [Stenotrophomonas sp. SAU14A_NAIMI4_8]|nr:hypothetical protein C1930_11545 [Stenotrophomonas sp. SAU14A_NAIMI4_8]